MEHKRLSDDEFREKLVEMYKKGNIKWSDIPKKHREYVAIKIFGRYPIRDFSQLGIICKSNDEVKNGDKT